MSDVKYVRPLYLIYIYIQLDLIVPKVVKGERLTKASYHSQFEFAENRAFKMLHGNDYGA